MKNNKSKLSCKRGFTRNCHAELVSASAPYRAESLNKDTFRAPLRSGFTLIELLVVVLIIGILAAVAVPQYQFAVAKSEVSGIIPLLSTLRKAEQLYYLNNGRYTYTLADLDLTIVGDAGSGGMIHNSFHINLGTKGYFTLTYCPHGGIGKGANNCAYISWFSYTEYFDNSSPRTCTIYRRTALSNKLCQILLDS